MNISENARVWIYQADRFLEEEEELKIQEQLNNFTSQWQAHGQLLYAVAEIRYHLFVILSVDEQQQAATGCSIDESIRLMKNLEQHFGIHFLDRLQIAYRDDSGVKYCKQEQFAKLLNNCVLSKEVTVFNNLVDTRKALQTDWEVPFKESWHAQVFV